MKTIKENGGKSNKADRKIVGFNYTKMSNARSETKDQKERFDKNNLSENDIDKIWAIA